MKLLHADKFWKVDKKGRRFFHDGSAGHGNRAYPNDRDIAVLDTDLHNAEIDFEITPRAKPADLPALHTALMFRVASVRDYQFYGIGLGGWGYSASLFACDGPAFWRIPIMPGGTGDLKVGKPYRFSVRIEGKGVSRLVLDGQEIRLPVQQLPMGYWSGHVGFYGYDISRARCEITRIRRLPFKCFLVVPIRDAYRPMLRRLRSLAEEVERRTHHRVQLALETAVDLPKDMPMMKRIAEAIRTSDIVIADFGVPETKHVYNVAYETGVAHVLDIPTIHIAGKFTSRKPPTDLRNQFFISRQHLARDLPKTIEAIAKRRIWLQNAW